jgi:hypothetical protein
MSLAFSEPPDVASHSCREGAVPLSSRVIREATSLSSLERAGEATTTEGKRRTARHQFHPWVTPAPGRS